MKALETDAAQLYMAYLREHLRKKTYKHCIRVAKLMLLCAEETGITEEQAVAAGLLHDMCKSMSSEDLLDEVERLGIKPSPVQRKKPALLHGAVAAAYCQEELGVEDEEVRDAIRWHTTGRPNWTMLGLTLYFADFSETGREHLAAAEARDILRDAGFAAAVRFTAQAKWAYLQEKPDVDPMTKAFNQWLMEAE